MVPLEEVSISNSSLPPLAVPGFSMPLSMMRYELGLLPTILKRIRLRLGYSGKNLVAPAY